jgi:hypothetical protein
MSTEDKEILEVLSCTVVPQLSAHMTFSFGSVKPDAKEGRRFASILFACPIRVDMYDDEGSNLEFESETNFIPISKEIPGVLASSKSKYLKEFLEKEYWVEAHSGKELTHYVVWSYGGGVVHVLSTSPPTLEEI